MKPAPQNLGINLAGYISSETGLGEAVRSEIRSVRAAGIPYVLNNVSDEVSENLDTTFTDFSEDNPYCVNLVHVNADQVPLFASQKGDDYFRRRYNIGYWFWELSHFPEEWQSSFQYFQEIWVASHFTFAAISQASPIPVTHIPISVQSDLPTVAVDRSRFDLPRDRCIFLFIFDYYSEVERKNPRGLIRAYTRAFRRGERATLVIKCSHGESFMSEVASLAREAGATDVRILHGVMSREEVNALLATCDCYVSLHRSEGYGLTIAEAMRLGKPVIATGYSGNMDFMTSLNSYNVNFKLIAINKDHGPYRRGGVWADPDLDHAASLMRSVYEDPSAGQVTGRRARQDICRSLDPKVVGWAVRKRLEALIASSATATGFAGAVTCLLGR